MGAAPRTPSQNRQIWGLVGQLARATSSSREEAEGTLRRLCMEISGQTHSSRLSTTQADKVISRMRWELGQLRADEEDLVPEREPWGPRGPGPRPARMITRRQLVFLEGLYQQAGMSTRAQQIGFSKRQCKGRPWPQTMKDFDAIVEALKAICMRKVDHVDAWRRTKALVGNSSLDDWKRGFVADLALQFEEAAAEGTVACVLTPGRLFKLIECEIAAGVQVGGEA